MTLTKGMVDCPLCGRAYAALASHFIRGHHVVNLAERAILCNMATGRILIRATPCSAAGCSYHSSRLDKHITNSHQELTTALRARLMADAKQHPSGADGQLPGYRGGRGARPG
ncbi:hypothetical protein AALO_G00273100 [Alosa alosa]|uniref:C2H2-type domain-containing protein n=1 Tax=Alosa alosa TaxID=278164 RepID=A0AAV6FMS2_9TELE|nr:hypothetical protein AALO_G00273100 [Alosa alosa]